MDFPRRIYKNGKLSVLSEKRLATSAKDLVLFAEDDFWPHEVNSKEEALKLPCVVEYLAELKRTKVEQKKEETIIEKALGIIPKRQAKRSK